MKNNDLTEHPKRPLKGPDKNKAAHRRAQGPASTRVHNARSVAVAVESGYQTSLNMGVMVNAPPTEGRVGLGTGPNRGLPAETLPLPAFHLRYIAVQDVNSDLHELVKTHTVNQNVPQVRGAQSFSLGLWVKASLLANVWLIAAFILASIASVFSLWYFFVMHQTMLYGDANAHLLIARRVLDNLTPGLAQLGGIWLPLPHLLAIPLVWNDFLWRTGLASSIVSMLCYLIATVYLFLAARRLTQNNIASFIGTLVFIAIIVVLGCVLIGKRLRFISGAASRLQRRGLNVK